MGCKVGRDRTDAALDPFLYSKMSKLLGIYVSSDRHLEQLINVCAAARRKGVASVADVYEASRTALGLAVGNFAVNLFVFDVSVIETAALRENIGWLTEMECALYSNDRANSRCGFICSSIEEMLGRLKRLDVIIPFDDYDGLIDLIFEADQVITWW